MKYENNNKIIIPKIRAYYWESDEIVKLFSNFKFESWNSGLNSTERKNLKRVSKVLDYLNELNSNNLKGNGEHFFYNVKVAIIDLMLEEGFKLMINDKTQNYYFKKLDLNKWENMSFKRHQKTLIKEAIEQGFNVGDLIPFSKEEVIKGLKTDEHLNNLPIKKWDNVADTNIIKSFINSVKKKYGYDGGVSLSDGVCFLKEYARTEYIKEGGLKNEY